LAENPRLKAALNGFCAVGWLASGDRLFEMKAFADLMMEYQPDARQRLAVERV
jgi:hypothetical protein